MLRTFARTIDRKVVASLRSEHWPFPSDTLAIYENGIANAGDRANHRDELVGPLQHYRAVCVGLVLAEARAGDGGGRRSLLDNIRGNPPVCY